MLDAFGQETRFMLSRSFIALSAALIFGCVALAQSQSLPSQNPKRDGITKSGPSQNAQKPNKRKNAHAAPSQSTFRGQADNSDPLDAAAQKREQREEEHLSIDRQSADAAIRSAKAADDLVISTNGLIKATDNLVGVTWVLVIVGSVGSFLLILQLYYVRRSVIDTGKSVELARAEFNATHRPQIRIKHVWLKSEIWEGEQIAVDLVFVNSGDAPAVVTQCAMATLLISKDDDLPNGHDTWAFDKNQYQMSVGFTIHRKDVTDGRTLSDQDNVDIRNGSKYLYCLGSVDYFDTYDRPKIMKTAFCRRLKIPSQAGVGVVGRSNRFVVHKDPDYEYQD
jgi:hypothetical protein